MEQRGCRLAETHLEVLEDSRDLGRELRPQVLVRSGTESIVRQPAGDCDLLVWCPANLFSGTDVAEALLYLRFQPFQGPVFLFEDGVPQDSDDERLQVNPVEHPVAKAGDVLRPRHGAKDVVESIVPGGTSEVVRRIPLERREANPRCLVHFTRYLRGVVFGRLAQASRSLVGTPRSLSAGRAGPTSSNVIPVPGGALIPKVSGLRPWTDCHRR